MRIYVSFLLLMVLSACSNMLFEPAASKAQASQQQQIELLLQKAARAVKRERFVAPQHDNANKYYQEIIALDGDNVEALLRVQELVEILSLRAKASIDVDRLQDYRVYVSWIEEVAPNSYRLAELKAIDPAKANNSRNSWSINRRDLTARNARAQSKIKQAALVAKAHQSRVKIVAPSDADGRWIYQQMRSYTDQYLFRSSLIIGEKAKIVALDAP